LILDGAKRYSPSVTVSAMMLPVNIHELLGMGIRAARQEKGWRQQDASNEFRSAGLHSWTPLAVGQVESGTRKPSVGDLVLACIALGVSLADLVPDVDENVDLGAGAIVPASDLKAILSGVSAGQLEVGGIVTPGDRWLAEALARSVAERERLEPLLLPIWDMARRRILREDKRRAFLPPTEAEQRAADRLGIEPAQLKAAARTLWGQDFEQERDARAGDASGIPPATLQARRGHATRAMLADLVEFLRAAGIEEGRLGVLRSE
jgi:transcriptional regulator with XRE-family HTH domain